MKYIVLLGDGMSDERMRNLAARRRSRLRQPPIWTSSAGAAGLAWHRRCRPATTLAVTWANLAVFGYDPSECYSGRSPLEAASMGVELEPSDVSFRLNFVWLEAHYGKLYMGDFSAGHITTEESKQLIVDLQKELGGGEFNFYPGVSYRHLLVWKNGRDQIRFTPPHDISTLSIEDYLPKGEGAEVLQELANSAQMILHDHPVNNTRVAAGKVPANSIWLWGEGRKPTMQTYQQRYGLRGSVISAVDLIKGIGTYAGLDVIEVPGGDRLHRHQLPWQS